MRRLAPLLLLVCALAAGARAEAPPPVDLAGLVAAHPDDPDLAWAYARALFDEQRYLEAAQALERLRARWPGRYPEAAFLHGRALLNAGELEAALAVVEAALDENPEDDALELLHAAILLRLARPADAREGLDRVASRDARFAELAGDLHPVLARERGEGLRARSAFAATRSSFSLQAYGGTEYDSNANVDNDAIPGPRVDDWRMVSGAGVTWRALRSERWRLDLGYRYDREDPIELDELARDRHEGEVSLRFGVSDRLAFTFDADVAATNLDRDRYYTGWRTRPGILLGLGPRAGLLRLFAEAGQDRFRKEPRLPSLERDALEVGGGAEHILAIPGWRGATASLRLDGRSHDTRAGTDLLGFRGAYDYDAVGARLRARGPLALGVFLDTALGWDGAWYDHPNVVDALTEVTLTPPRRHDDLLWSRLSLIRPLHRLVQLELSWRHYDRHSNVDVYRIRSDVVGMYLTLTAW